MTKTTRHRKQLALSTQTVRALTDASMASAAGGLSGNRGCNYSQACHTLDCSFSLERGDCHSGIGIATCTC